ncbi:hypothetical protein GGR26_003042 [Lewinella marina]|uniref:Uncharacterized protein n=1 Tax=Neolewinella marina TaxID=438751 RepID=A0A2G0CEL2_9BACT|nr:hypothetical protein [Neolewinella marina]NJB87262.1 hypothetical protein [Neolewinella marina]PHK98413.1 hypothetical protein CGL56_12020 [Neolewinella marina]
MTHPLPHFAPAENEGFDPERDLRESVSTRVHALWQTKRQLRAVMERRKLPNTYETWRRIKLVYDPAAKRQQYILDYGTAKELLLL